MVSRPGSGPVLVHESRAEMLSRLAARFCEREARARRSERLNERQKIST
jgi:hypothetical protein